MTNTTKNSLEVFFMNGLADIEVELRGFFQALRFARGSTLAASHFLQRMTPRKLQMMQMKVPQFAHG